MLWLRTIDGAVADWLSTGLPSSGLRDVEKSHVDMCKDGGEVDEGLSVSELVDPEPLRGCE